MTTSVAPPRAWNHRRKAKADRLAATSAYRNGKVIDGTRRRETSEELLRPGNRVALEGDNQKQADFLSRTLAQCDPHRVHGQHMLIGSLSGPEHLELFENGVAMLLDLAYAGPQRVRIAQLGEDGTATIGAIHAYVELYARMFTHLTSDVALLCADLADRNGASRAMTR